MTRETAQHDRTQLANRPEDRDDILSGSPIFFLHLPKTAGTTLNNIVESHFKTEEICPLFYNTELLGAAPETLHGYRYFRGHLRHSSLVRRLGRTPVTLTMLRQPVEQLRSAFAHMQRLSAADWIRSTSVDPSILERFRNATLEELVDDPDMLRAIRNQQLKYLRPEPAAGHDPPQLDCDADLRGAQRMLSEFAFTGLSERFQESVFLLAWTFGWYPVTGYPSLNVDTSGSGRERVPDSTLERIRETNAPDQLLYDFAERLFETRYRAMELELLSGYGSARHARLKPPLPHEVTRDLLRKHYERWFTRRHPAVSNLRFGFDQPIAGATFWHRIDQVPEHGASRWTGPETSSYLDFPLSSDTDLTLRFRVLMGITPAIVDSLRLTVNDESVELARSSDAAGGLWFEARISRRILAKQPGLTRLTFEVNDTAAPCELDPLNKDSRRLGVLFNRIEFDPTNGGCQGGGQRESSADGACAAERAETGQPDVREGVAADAIETGSARVGPPSTAPLREVYSRALKFSNRTENEIRAAIASVPVWYHQITFKPGIVTPGVNLSDRVLRELELPEDLRGARALDLGTRDGYFAFELERRGADVLAVDYCPADATGFAVAADLLESKVRFQQANISELRAKNLGTFDVVLFLGLIYHLPDPMRALRIVRSLSRKWMWLESHLGFTSPPRESDVPMMIFYPRASLGGDPTNYWGPNMACLRAMLEENEFKVLAESTIDNRGFFRCETVEDANLAAMSRLAYGSDDPRGD